MYPKHVGHENGVCGPLGRAPSIACAIFWLLKCAWSLLAKVACYTYLNKTQGRCGGYSQTLSGRTVYNIYNQKGQVTICGDLHSQLSNTVGHRLQHPGLSLSALLSSVLQLAVTARSHINLLSVFGSPSANQPRLPCSKLFGHTLVSSLAPSLLRDTRSG